MQNQMDDLITNGLHQMDEFITDLDNRIWAFIEQNDYDFTVSEIVNQYREKYSKGYYVSYTCKKVIEHFKEDLKKATGL